MDFGVEVFVFIGVAAYFEESAGFNGGLVDGLFGENGDSVTSGFSDERFVGGSGGGYDDTVDGIVMLVNCFGE